MSKIKKNSPKGGIKQGPIKPDIEKGPPKLPEPGTYLKELKRIDSVIGLSLAKQHLQEFKGGKEQLPGPLRIAILDSGIIQGQSMIQPGRLESRDLVNEGPATDKFHGYDYGKPNHGSEVAFVIGGSDVGIAPECIIHNLKCFRKDGKASWPTIRQGLSFVKEFNQNRPADDRIRVVLLAIEQRNGAYKTPAPLSRKDSIRDLIIELTREGVAVVACSGNKKEETGSMNYPAILPWVISVGAVKLPPTQTGTANDAPDLASNANITPFEDTQLLISRTTVLAPGFPKKMGEIAGNVWGTSLASACVAGAVLLIMEKYRIVHGSFPSVDEVKQFLRNGGDHTLDNVRTNKTNGEYPRLNIFDSLQLIY